jgi:hypothetical protein
MDKDNEDILDYYLKQNQIDHERVEKSTDFNEDWEIS